jgi:hypothetical protein
MLTTTSAVILVCSIEEKREGREITLYVCFVKVLKKEEREKEQTDETSRSRQKIEKEKVENTITITRAELFDFTVKIEKENDSFINALHTYLSLIGKFYQLE